MRTMSELKRQHSYLYTVLFAFSLCVILSICCFVNGQAIASTHLELQYKIAEIQIVIAAVLAIMLYTNKRTRKIKWFLIPYILIAFAPLYVFIVNQYPCCTGG